MNLYQSRINLANWFIAFIGAILTFLAFYVQYAFNSRQKEDIANERFENKLYGMECVACGSCTYICPAKRPLMQLFKQTKAEIMAAKRAAQAAKK